MLHKLVIRNYAIIDHVEISFSENINIITGETGAGKSILIGALSLILGHRADGKTLYDPTEKCIVEGIFNLKGHHLESFFEKEDLDYEETTIIRRQINPAGKSRSFVNDIPVNLSVLKRLGDQLVNFHSQHETLSLGNSKFQIQLVDILVNHKGNLHKFKSVFSEYKNLITELSQIRDENKAITDQDYLNFQLNELVEAQLDATQAEKIENELKTLENAEDIKVQLFTAQEKLRDTDYSIISQMNDVVGSLRNVEAYNQSILLINRRLESCFIEVKDIVNEIEAIEQAITVDPDRVEVLNDQLNTTNRLLQKHRVDSVGELINIKEALAAKLYSFAEINKKLEVLQAAISKSQSNLLALGKLLHQTRLDGLPAIEKQVAKRLKNVGMPNARFKIEITALPFDKISADGLDNIKFTFSANPGSSLEDLKKVASGGELSRLMLILKSIIATNTQLPTLIFDEIDTGVSGEVAIKVGKILENLGNEHQVISITHLPQIAKVGDTHFYVYKEILNDKTSTKIKKLSKEDRVVEIAKMIGGDKFTETALKNAKELLLN